MSRRRPSGNWFEYSVIFQSGATYVGMRDSAATMISTRLRTSRRISKNSFALSTMLFIDFSFLTRSARHGIPQPYAHASVLAVEQAAEKVSTAKTPREQFGEYLRIRAVLGTSLDQSLHVQKRHGGSSFI